MIWTKWTRFEQFRIAYKYSNVLKIRYCEYMHNLYAWWGQTVEAKLISSSPKKDCLIYLGSFSRKSIECRYPGMKNLIFDDFSFSKIRFSFASSWESCEWSWTHVTILKHFWTNFRCGNARGQGIKVPWIMLK